MTKQSLVNKIQCDTKECIHHTDDDLCELKEIIEDRDGYCLEFKKVI